MAPSDPENEPLLPAPVTHPARTSPPTSPSAHVLAPPPRASRLNARRTTLLTHLSEKSKGKQRATDQDADESAPLLDSSQLSGGASGSRPVSRHGSLDETRPPPRALGRSATVIFSGESDGAAEGNLEIWLEDGESVGKVKEQIRHLRPSLADRTLRLIHAGRMLTDGVLLLSWLRSLEERVKRQTGGVGGDMEDVLKEVGKEVGLTESSAPKREQERVWLHCVVGAKIEKDKGKGREQGRGAGEGSLGGDDGGQGSEPPRRRGFDVLLDAGLSADEVAQMRRQFYESRGEDVPENLDTTNDEHARALEEQWIEGDITAETATTTTEGAYTSILNGLLTGFLFPITPWFFFREAPLPNFFDADAEAAGNTEGGISGRVAESLHIGGETQNSVVFGKGMQTGMLFGLIINLVIGALRFLI